MATRQISSDISSVTFISHLCLVVILQTDVEFHELIVHFIFSVLETLPKLFRVSKPPPKPIGLSVRFLEGSMQLETGEKRSFCPTTEDSELLQLFG